MKRIAIFTEGESDMIFTSYLLKVIFEFNEIKLKYIGWTSNDTYTPDVSAEEVFGDVQIEFVIFNFGNDQRVVNKLKENGKTMLKNGYDTVIGVRDLGSQKYDELANGKIDTTVSRTMIDSTRSVLDGLGLFFAVMELEAWYLALPDCLKESGYDLGVINSKIGFNLEVIDPEEEFYNPKGKVKAFEVAFNEVQFAHKIGSKLNLSHLEKIESSGKVQHFVEYITALKSYR